jgi:glycerol kinase
MSKLLLAIDQGTTGTTALVVDTEGQTVGRATVDFPQHFPKPGWVEHDPKEIWASVEAAVRGAFASAKIDGSAIAAIGITNQRETTLVWDRATHEPIANAIVWQCRRTADTCDALRSAGHEARVREVSGLVLDAYFSGTKVAWILDHVEGARARAEKGELAFGTVDSFLVWRLTSGLVHVTDATNASRTLLMNLRSLAWDAWACELFRVPPEVLPKIVGSAEIVGTTRGISFLPDGVPIAGIAGDQQAALFGQACFELGDAKCTYGTGAFALVNVGSEPVMSKNGLVTTVGFRIGNETTYALEGSSFIAGAAVQWLRDGLGLVATAKDIEPLAAQVDGTGGVYFVPALAGLGAPHWDQGARGTISGITRGHHQGASRAGHARGHRVLGGRPALGHGERRGPPARAAPGRRGRVAERSAHAVPVRRVERGRRAADRGRVDRARRGDARGPRRRSRRPHQRSADAEAREALRAENERRRARRAPRRVGRRRT